MNDAHRIVALRATPVNIPLEMPYRWSLGWVPGFSRTIVEIETDSGHVGIGEAPSPAYAGIVAGWMQEALIGADPLDLAECERRCVGLSAAYRNSEDGAEERAYGGIEMALWDLRGKLLGQSVAQLLGGRQRDTVLFTEYFAPRPWNEGGERTNQQLIDYCVRMREEHGSHYFEGKVGSPRVQDDVRLVQGLREALGEDAFLRVDANMGWTVSEAAYALSAFAELGVRWVEEPVRSFAELARLRAMSSIPFSSHEPSLQHAARLGTPDAFVTNLAVLGGVRRAVQFIGACEELGFEFWFYSPDTGVGNAAYLQVCAALDWLHQPNQTLLRWHTDDVIVGGPFRPERNEVVVPDGPGFGVELDPEGLRRCHERFLEEGPYDTHHDPDRPGQRGFARAAH